MAVLLTNDGATVMALVKMGFQNYTPLTVQLMGLPWTPAYTDVFSTLNPYISTRSGNFQLIDPTSWTGTVTGGVWTGQAAPILFTLGSGLSTDQITGYYVYDVSHKVIWEEVYPTPIALPAASTHWIVVPTLVEHMG